MNVIEAIRTRRSIRAYAPTPIPQPTLQQLREALRLAPSACNYQPWSFIFVQDPTLRKALGSAANEQTWLAQAPLVVVVCVWPQQAYKKMAGHINSAIIDGAIALDHLTLAATEHGLGTCWIGAFNEPRVKKLLDIPEAAVVPAMTPVGYPADPQSLRPLQPTQRKPEHDLFYEDRHGQPV